MISEKYEINMWHKYARQYELDQANPFNNELDIIAMYELTRILDNQSFNRYIFKILNANLGSFAYEGIIHGAHALLLCKLGYKIFNEWQDIRLQVRPKTTEREETPRAIVTTRYAKAQAKRSRLSIRFYKAISEDARVLYTTDGVLLQELTSDEQLSKYSCIIIGGAHERSLATKEFSDTGSLSYDERICHSEQ
ncbi:Uu.00g056890.m01.CDS01 [Anthostomella pinea]|uniref:Uu.00g056890.m01.CDS01 n=1 Tax=Anthostomella pinea TaxID=933095 RepID=A0AAI8VS84_9PEZI|nr:Uu.00g056890.m01.CDS01 [Anthostomella pinea]